MASVWTAAAFVKKAGKALIAVSSMKRPGNAYLTAQAKAFSTSSPKPVNATKVS